MNDPDPGHYYEAPKWNDLKSIDKTYLKYKSQEHKDHAVIPNTVAPSIPARKLAATAYTGRGFDPHTPTGVSAIAVNAVLVRVDDEEVVCLCHVQAPGNRVGAPSLVGRCLLLYPGQYVTQTHPTYPTHTSARGVSDGEWGT